MEAWSFDSRRFGRGEARLEVGKVEEVVGNFYAQRIEARQPEGGDRREGRRRLALLKLWLNGEEES